jgi:hypothetical protein
MSSTFNAWLFYEIYAPNSWQVKVWRKNDLCLRIQLSTLTFARTKATNLDLPRPSSESKVLAQPRKVNS